MVLHDLNVLLETTQLPSWTPLVVAIVMFVALAWLWGSMRMHLKRADYPDDDEAEGVAEGTSEDAEMSSPSSPGSATQA